jgi:hypothetical protein
MGPFTEKDLAMEDKHGWQFWYSDNGRIRQFMVEKPRSVLKRTTPT